jgi:hypothetical protein
MAYTLKSTTVVIMSKSVHLSTQWQNGNKTSFETFCTCFTQAANFQPLLTHVPFLAQPLSMHPF